MGTHGHEGGGWLNEDQRSSLNAASKKALAEHDIARDRRLAEFLSAEDPDKDSEQIAIDRKAWLATFVEFRCAEDRLAAESEVLPREQEEADEQAK